MKMIRVSVRAIPFVFCVKQLFHSLNEIVASLNVHIINFLEGVVLYESSQTFETFANPGVQGSPCRGLGCLQSFLSPFLARRRRASKRKEKKKGFSGDTPAPRQEGNCPPAPPARDSSQHSRFCGLLQTSGMTHKSIYTFYICHGNDTGLLIESVLFIVLSKETVV